MKPNYKILVVEHNPDDIELLQFELSKIDLDFDVKVVKDEVEYVTAIKTFIPDIILSDYSLPSFNGDAVLQIRAELAPDTPFIFVSGSIGEEKSIEYIKTGVTDYVLKDKLFTLEVKVKRALHEATERIQKRKVEIDLIKSENRFRALIEKSNEMVMLSRDNGKIFYISPSVKKTLGYSFNEEDKTILCTLIHADDLKQFEIKRLEILNSPDTSSQCQVRLLNTNGQWVWCESILTNMLQEPGVNAIVLNLRDISERKSAEMLAEFSRNNLDALINNTHNMMWSVDKNYKLISSNIRFDEKIAGTLNTTIEIGMSVLTDLYEPDKLSRMKKLYDRALKGETFTVIEKVNDPVTYWSETSFYPIRRGKEIIGTACYSQDITERKKAEEDKNFKAKLLNMIGQAVVATNLQGTVTFWNKAAEEIYGWTTDEAMDKNIRKLIPAYESVDQANEIINQLKHGHTWSGEFMVNNKSGSSFPIYLTDAPVYDNDNKLSGIIGISTNISERKKAEQLLLESENYLRAIIHAEPECVKVIDKNGLLQEMNPAGLAMIEAENIDQVKGHSILDLVKEPYREAFNRLTKDGFNGMSGILEFEITGLKGTPRWLETNSVPLRNVKGKIISLLSVTRDITERKKSEDKIRKSHERFINVSKATFDVVWDWDINTKHLYLGDGFKELFGYDVDEHQNFNSWSDHIHPDDRERVIKNKLNKITQHDVQNWQDDYKYLRADGSIAYVSDRGKLLRNEDGIYRMIGAMQDVTEKKKLELLLDKANSLAHFGGWEMDIINKSLSWTKATKEIHEVPQDYQPTLETAINFYKEGESRQIIQQKVNDAIIKGKSWDVELQIITANGTEKWVRAVGEPQLENKKCVSVLGSFQDISKRKTAELELVKAFDEKNAILESIGDAFFAVNKDWIVTYWNRRAEEMLNKPRSQVIGYNLWDIFSEGTKSLSYQKYHEVVLTNKALQFEDYYPPLNKWYAISSYPSENGLSVFFKDISEQKLADIQLKELNADLKKHAQELAASNEELERFAYVTSHDLQEPLRMVTSFLQLLEQKYQNQLDDKALKYIGFAVDGARRMKTLILDLLEFSRINSVKVPHQLINVNNVILKTQQTLKTAIDESGATFHIPLLPKVSGNESQFLQLFQNMISNAIKYKSSEKPIIEIGYDDEGDTFKFYIKDNGIGINEKFYDKVFIIFQRLHNKSEYEGTGIGLAICKKIVELHGGNIWVQSSNTGSTFYFRIPKNI